MWVSFFFEVSTMPTQQIMTHTSTDWRTSLQNSCTFRAAMSTEMGENPDHCVCVCCGNRSLFEGGTAREIEKQHLVRESRRDSVGRAHIQPRSRAILLKTYRALLGREHEEITLQKKTLFEQSCAHNDHS